MIVKESEKLSGIRGCFSGSRLWYEVDSAHTSPESPSVDTPEETAHIVYSTWHRRSSCVASEVDLVTYCPWQDSDGIVVHLHGR